MDSQRQQRINEAAQRFTDAAVAAYRATSDRTVVAQRLAAQQTAYFFNTVISQLLRNQAGGAVQITQRLADQQQRAQEATRVLTQASTDTYMDLLDSMFSFYQGGTSRIRRRAEEAQRLVEEAELRALEAERRAEEAEERAEQAQLRSQQAESSRSEAQRQTEEAQRRAREAQRSKEEAERRAQEAESRAEESKRRVEQAQKRIEEAERRAEEAVRSRQEAQRRAEEAERNAGEAQRRAEEAERRVEQAQGRSQGAQRGTEEGQSSIGEAESQGNDDLPLADFDALNVDQISARLNELSIEEIRRLRDYEVNNKNRRTLVQRLTARLEASAS